ncbi:MAG: hypothetical protein V4665_01455 [Patescibacteria group bacterium]
MIHILVGADTKKRSAFLKTLIGSRESLRLEGASLSESVVAQYAEETSLFGESPVIILDGAFSQSGIAFSAKFWEQLKNSLTVFVFLEDNLRATDEKKYVKYASVERFEEKKSTAREQKKTDPFALAEAFGQRDKIGAWMLYREAVEKGADPEPISGMLFWKIKTMTLTGTRHFEAMELKRQSRDLVDLYHRAHRGECDFVIGLEEFILSSLSK